MGQLRCAALAVIIFGIFGGLNAPVAWARGLSAGVRIQQEFKPKIPTQRKLVTCFKADATGAMVLGLCPEAVSERDNLNRLPASLPPAPTMIPKRVIPKSSQPRSPAKGG